MNIKKQQIDDLNAIVTVAISKDDYAVKVNKVLADYKKNANIPGFRKGAVPMSLIQKQYGKAVLLDEVNKILQDSLNNYLVEEKLDILGNPLPKVTDDFDWNKENFSFEFELGLAPQFSVDLSAKSNLTKYNIIADDDMINEQIVRIQKQYGKIISEDIASLSSDIRGTFENAEKGIKNTVTIAIDAFKNKSDRDKIVGKRVGDVVEFNSKGLFDDDHKLMDYLKISHDEVHSLDVPLQFTIESISSTEKAELNNELFDKLFGNGIVNSVEELKAKIKEDAEAQFAQQADQKFFNDVTDYLVNNTHFNLPSEFLKRWIQTVGENPLTLEQAEEEYNKSEKGLRYQLIEAKILADNNIKIDFESLKEHTSNIIRKQMAQFGQANPSQEDVDQITSRVLTNQDEVKRLSEQVVSEKLLQLFKDKVQAKQKEVNYQEFIKEMYGE